jgi:hypothetical protein
MRPMTRLRSNLYEQRLDGPLSYLTAHDHGYAVCLGYGRRR